MDTFIGLGIVIKNNETAEKEIEGFLSLLETHTSELELTYPDEGDYEDWKSMRLVNDYVDNIDDFAMKDACASYVLRISNVPFETKMTITNFGEDVVIQLKLEDSFSTKRSIHELETLTQGIATFIEGFENYFSYDYIFCDNEAEYLYTKERMMELGFNPYAILKLYDRRVVFSSWYLDGQTEKN